MNPAAALRERYDAEWRAVTGHRLFAEIRAGDIDPAVLAHYAAQDNYFFDPFVQMLGAAVAAADQGAARLAPMALRPPLTPVAPGELRRVRMTWARQLGVLGAAEDTWFDRTLDTLDVKDAARTPEPTQATVDFRSVMSAAARGTDYVALVTIVLVCEWLYLDWPRPLGLLLPAGSPVANACAEWIKLHRGPQFEAWVEFLIAELAASYPADPARRDAIDTLFAQVIDLEWRFCEDAYPTLPNRAYFPPAPERASR